MANYAFLVCKIWLCKFLAQNFGRVNFFLTNFMSDSVLYLVFDASNICNICNVLVMCICLFYMTNYTLCNWSDRKDKLEAQQHMIMVDGCVA